ncbi:DUF4394 domain-containing protein, partial [Jatrophihabitans endophyticus]|uniref:DUF4394 domain-containing protein n=1 Tax=Jatrophihabitans endophyticus TaxID=1206085 RepID=UPI0019FF572B
MTRLLTTTALCTAAFLFAGSPRADAQTLLYGVGGTDTGAGPNAAAYTLFDFSSAAPSATTTVGTVTTSAGYALESIAFQPTTGSLYGFQYNGTTNQGQLVTINRSTGALATVGTAFTIGSISGSAGNSATISFNPTNGVVQLVTGTYGNYRINPATGGLLGQDASVAYAAGDTNANNTFQISSLAHNNAGTLYDIDYINNVLTTQDLSTGALHTVGLLGFTATQGAPSEGFTIGAGNAAFLNSTASTQGGAVRDSLYSVNLATGAATSLGAIGGSATFNTVDLAAYVVPEPGTTGI